MACTVNETAVLGTTLFSLLGWLVTLGGSSRQNNGTCGWHVWLIHDKNIQTLQKGAWSLPSCEWSSNLRFSPAFISCTVASFSTSACCFCSSASCNLCSSSASWVVSLSNPNNCSKLLATFWHFCSSLPSCAAVASFSWRELDRTSTSLLRWLISALQASICCDLSSDSVLMLDSCCYRVWNKVSLTQRAATSLLVSWDECIQYWQQDC